MAQGLMQDVSGAVKHLFGDRLRHIADRDMNGERYDRKRRASQHHHNLLNIAQMRQKFRMPGKLKPGSVLQNRLMNGRSAQTGHLSGLGEPHRLFNGRNDPGRIARIWAARMRGLGEIYVMQPYVICWRRCRIGLKQRDRNVPRQMPLIGKKDHRDLGANLFLRSSKYFKPNASGIAAGHGKGRVCGLICHHQSTCTKNQISKRQEPSLLDLKLC
jgi:hypothetical protein